MKKLLNLTQILLIAALAFSFTACDDEDDDMVVVEEDIASFIANDNDFEQLLSATNRANLTDILATADPITLFAPDDDAFDAFLQTNGFAAIEDIPVDVLGNALTNHVIGGDFEALNFQTGYYTTLSEIEHDEGVNTLIFVNTNDGVVLNGQARVTEANNTVGNGTIHVIDNVITPPTIVTFATADPNFDMLEAALARTDLPTDFIEILSGEGPYTVFAPTNAAFEALLDSNDDWSTLADIPVATLEKVLKTHVVIGNNRSENIQDEMVVNTLEEGESLMINIDATTSTVIAGSSQAEIITFNIQAENGVIHAINTVLLPENL